MKEAKELTTEENPIDEKQAGGQGAQKVEVSSWKRKHTKMTTYMVLEIPV